MLLVSHLCCTYILLAIPLSKLNGSLSWVIYSIVGHLLIIFRPYYKSCWKEMLEMQGIPMYPDSLKAAGCSEPFFDASIVSTTAQKRLSGNSFQQGCMTALLAFSLSFVMPTAEFEAIPATVRPVLAPSAKHVFCLNPRMRTALMGMGTRTWRMNMRDELKLVGEASQLLLTFFWCGSNVRPVDQRKVNLASQPAN